MFRRNPAELVTLGELVSLAYRSGSGRIKLKSFAEGQAIVAYNVATGRIVLVFAPVSAGRGTAKGAKEYARTHWGAAAKGERLEGDTLAGKAPKLGPAVAITYATCKGDDAELVNYWHKFGDYGDEKPWGFIPPGLSAASCGGRMLYRLDGGTYKVKEHGIVG